MEWLLIVGAALVALAVATRALTWRATRRAPRLGRTVAVDGVELHYVDKGAGPPVVFLHGAKGSAWDAVLSIVPLLAHRHRVVAFDRPGSGYSGRADDGNGSPFVQAELLHGAMKALALPPCLLVAHSAGAPVALALALQYPDDVAAVLTLGGYVFSARDATRAPNRALTAPLVGVLLRHTIAVPLGRLLARVVVRHVFAPDRPDARYARLAPGLALRPDRLAGDARDLPELEAGLRSLAGRYADLRVPLVAVHGLADYVVGSGQAVRLCQVVPRCDLVLLEETGHMPHFTRPDAVRDAVALAFRRARGAGRDGAGAAGAAADPGSAEGGAQSAGTFAPSAAPA